MKKLFMPYYILIVTLGLLITANILLFQSKSLYIDATFIFILVMASISESASYYFTKNTSVTLSSSVILFASMFLSISNIALLLFLIVTFSRVVGVQRKEFKSVFDMKWLFNYTSFLIVAFVAVFAFEYLDFRFLNALDQFIVLAVVCLGYIFLNASLTFIVISLSTGENVFKNQNFRELTIFNFYTIMFTSLLWFGYSSYHNAALLFLAVLIIPLQRSIVIQFKSEEINQQLIEDRLTKALNRHYFDDLIYEKLEKKMEFGLIFLDLDRFKSINDTYGHLVGDEVLIDLVQKIKSYIRNNDVIVRYGGDEFCIVTYDMAFGEILYEILKKNMDHFYLDNTHDKVEYTFTMSLTLYDGLNRDSYRNIMNEADRCMYERKQVS